MILGKVVGTVVATQKDSGLEGFKLQVVQALDIQTLKPESRFLVAVDAVGAGVNEVVLCTIGSSARMTGSTEDRPVDAVVIGIVDSVEMEGETTYRKHP